jgi:hypothetical protein
MGDMKPNTAEGSVDKGIKICSEEGNIIRVFRENRTGDVLVVGAKPSARYATGIVPEKRIRFKSCPRDAEEFVPLFDFLAEKCRGSAMVGIVSAFFRE